MSLQWFRVHKDLFSITQNGFSYVPIYEYQEILQYINKKGSILDVGCGNGALLLYISQCSQHSIIPYGIDIRSDCIADARELHPLHKDNFLVHDIHTMNLTKKFDIIVCGLPYSSDHDPIVQKLYDALAYNGRLLLYFFTSANVSSMIADSPEHLLRQKYGAKIKADAIMIWCVIDKDNI